VAGGEECSLNSWEEYASQSLDLFGAPSTNFFLRGILAWHFAGLCPAKSPAKRTELMIFEIKSSMGVRTKVQSMPSAAAPGGTTNVQ